MADEPAKTTEPEKPHNKLDEGKPAPAPAKKAAEGKVFLRTRRGEVLDLSAHDLGVLTEAGREYTKAEADSVRVLARKSRVYVAEGKK